MNILVVTARPILPAGPFAFGNYTVYFRSFTSGLKTLAADFIVCGPGLSNEQIALAAECLARGRDRESDRLSSNF